MQITIKDVAKHANVAPSTVSRVIANSPRISQKTKERVRSSMEELGYHPNIHARSLANRSTQSIGLVMPSAATKTLQNPFFPEVLRGISTKAHQNGYSLYMTTGVTEEEVLSGVIEMVQGRRVDGVIVLYSREDDQVVQYLRQTKFPFVVVGKPFGDASSITYVDTDNYLAGREVTKHLYNLGHRRIAFIGGSDKLAVTQDRRNGYATALMEAGIPVCEEYIARAEFMTKGGAKAVRELLQNEEPPTAVVVSDDMMALGVISTLSEMGLKIPEDVAVVSFNNVYIAEHSNPPLTSVEINIFGLGFEATNCLLEQISDNAPPYGKRVIVPHYLVVRQSCGQKKSKATETLESNS